MVEHFLMVRWVVGSVPHGGPIEQFLVVASAPQLLFIKTLTYVLSCLWHGAYKVTLAANQKE